MFLGALPAKQDLPGEQDQQGVIATARRCAPVGCRDYGVEFVPAETIGDPPDGSFAFDGQHPSGDECRRPTSIGLIAW